MDLSLRFTILSAATVIFTLFALVFFFTQTRFRWLHHFNEDFLALFGIQTEHPLEIRYLTSWLITTCLATVNFTLLINVGDAIFLLTGFSGIPPDVWVMSLAVGGIIASLILIIVSLLPALTMPPSWLAALGIVGFLHLYSVHYAETMLGLVSTFLYFAATAIGFVAVFLALYLILRNYLGAALFCRIKNRSNDSSNNTVSAFSA